MLSHWKRKKKASRNFGFLSGFDTKWSFLRTQRNEPTWDKNKCLPHFLSDRFLQTGCTLTWVSCKFGTNNLQVFHKILLQRKKERKKEKGSKNISLPILTCCMFMPVILWWNPEATEYNRSALCLFLKSWTGFVAVVSKNKNIMKSFRKNSRRMRYAEAVREEQCPTNFGVFSIPWRHQKCDFYFKLAPLRLYYQNFSIYSWSPWETFFDYKVWSSSPNLRAKFFIEITKITYIKKKSTTFFCKQFSICMLKERLNLKIKPGQNVYKITFFLLHLFHGEGEKPWSNKHNMQTIKKDKTN